MNRSREPTAVAPQGLPPPATAGSADQAARQRGRGALTWLGRIGVAVALAVIAALAAGAAYYQVFTIFGIPDDEGLMMMSVRHVLDGHRLYDEVRIGYGPLYYLIKGTIHGWLGVPLTHDTVRLTATAFRLLAAGLAGGALLAMTGHVTLAGFGFLLTTMHLVIVTREPGHPQELAALLLMATVLTALAMRSRRAPAVVAGLGFLVAGMAMTKTNLGVFTGIAVWMAVLASMPANRLRLVLWVASAATATALPIILMRPHLNTAWGGLNAGCAAASIFAVAMLATPHRDGGLRPAHLVLLAAAVTGGIGLLLLPHVLSGTSLTTLIERLLVGPHSLVAYFVAPFWSPPRRVPTTVAGVALAALAAWTLPVIGRRQNTAHVIGLAKLAFAVLVVREVYWARPHLLVGMLVPFAWLVLVPGGYGRWSWEHRFGRLLLAWLAVLHPLQVYPVSGSQKYMASLALVLCAVVCLGDAADWARGLLRASVRRPARAVAAAAMLGWTITLAASWHDAYEALYRAGTPLELPGATRFRLQKDFTDMLRQLVDTVRDNCNPVFTYPGFNSLYFWIGQAPPTLELVSHEIRLVGDDRLDEIYEVLAQSPTACLVRAPGLARQPPERAFEARMQWLFGNARETHSSVIKIGKIRVLKRVTRWVDPPQFPARDSAAAPG
jgi:hypothetical protein